MQKTSKVTSATFDREFKGEFGAYFVHLVEFENNDKGEYTSQKKDQTNFVVGKDAMYDIVEKKNRNDEKFFKIIPVKEDDQKFERDGKKMIAYNDPIGKNRQKKRRDQEDEVEDRDLKIS